MARTAASIQAEIDTLEALLGSSSGVVASTASDGTSMSHASYESMTKRLDRLYQQLGRVNGTSPMFVRGQVTGLRGRV